MDAHLNSLETALMGGPVFDLRDLAAAASFPDLEASILLPERPRLAVAKIPAGDIATVRSLEQHGFRFAEFQIELRHTLKMRPEIPAWPYRWEAVTDEASLLEVLALAQTIFTHDRFSTDPDMPAGISGARYRTYVERSFLAEDERVFAMRSNEGGRVLSFATLKHLSPRDVRLLLGGVAADMKNCGLGVIHDQLGLATYWDLGIRTIHSAVSGFNIPIINLEVAHLGFKAVRSWVVLHKHYLPH